MSADTHARVSTLIAPSTCTMPATAPAFPSAASHPAATAAAASAPASSVPVSNQHRAAAALNPASQVDGGATGAAAAAARAQAEPTARDLAMREAQRRWQVGGGVHESVRGSFGA